jgi:hypothetical protein
MGVVAVASKARPATQERRQRRSGDDFLKVEVPLARGTAIEPPRVRN